MRRYILSFESNEAVKEFLTMINTKQVEFSMKNNIVICSCSEEELGIARNRFGATIDELINPDFN
jgi:hypothetical protein